MFMYFTYFYTRLRQSIPFFGSATNWAIAQLGNRFNFPTIHSDRRQRFRHLYQAACKSKIPGTCWAAWAVCNHVQGVKILSIYIHYSLTQGEVLNLYVIYAWNGMINVLLPFTDLLHNAQPYVACPASFLSHLHLWSWDVSTTLISFIY